MPNVMDKKIPINATPGAWLYVFEQVAGTYEFPSIIGTDLSKQMRFDNTKTPNIALTRPPAVSAGAADEYVQINRADAAIIQFIKDKLTIDGATGEAVAGTGITAAGGSGGTMSFISNQADIDSAEYVAFLNKVKSFLGATILVCLPLGFNYNKRKAGVSSGGVVAPLGYAYMIGTLTADPAHAVDGYAPAAMTWSFASKKLGLGDSDITDPHAALDLGASAHKILIPTNIASGTPTGYELKPPSIALLTAGAITADFQTLLDGEVLIKIGAEA